MSFPRYQRYKNSGVEWLSELPEAWELKRLRFLCFIRKGRLPGDTFPSPVAATDVPYLSMEFLRGETDNPNYVQSSPNLVYAEHGDILLLWDGSNAGEFLRAKQGVVSSTVALIKSKNIQREFLFFVCKAFEQRIRDQTIGMGIPHVSGDELRSFSVPCPDHAEQSQIAEFLDRETAKIDALVDEQRRLIELLNEKRQAVISHAVTKGLDPHLPMKDSGVNWLGEVPKHWDVIRIKWVAGMESGHTPDKKVDAYWTNCEIPWVSLHDTGFLKENDFITETAQYVNELGIANSSARLLPAEAVVFSRDATIGRCGITTRPMAVSQHFIAWICGDRILPEYLLRVLRCMAGELDKLTFGATVKTIGMPDVRQLTTPLPPVQEQSRIAQHIRSKLSELDAFISEAESAIAILRERKSALIFAVVTGKIDVRQLIQVKAEAA